MNCCLIWLVNFLGHFSSPIALDPLAIPPQPQLLDSSLFSVRMFGSSSAFGSSNAGTGGFGAAANQTGSTNPMKDFEVSAAPDDSISCLRFSPPALNSTFLIAGSWDNNVRLWEIQANGTSEPRHQQSMQASLNEKRVRKPTIAQAHMDFAPCPACCS